VPEDPVAALLGQLGALNANLLSTLNTGFKSVEMILPHNVIPKLMAGGGYYSAKIPTPQLNRMNIF